MTDKAYAVPLHEQLARVPRDARLVIDDLDGMGTRFIPVGRYCHEAAEALRAALAQPEQEEDYDAIANKQLASLKAAAKVTFEDAVVRAVHKLYNAPPQREWQGLTDEEIENCFEMSMFGTCRAIEAKLREKNTKGE